MVEHKPTDAALIHQACKELPYVAVAYEALMKRYENELTRTAIYKMGNRDDGIEAVQEAMLKVFFHLKKFKGNASFKTWIYRILFNVCNDMYRKSKPYAVDLSEIAETLADVDVITPISDKVDMDKMLARLDAKQKEVVVLRLCADMSFQEIASTCDSSLSAVKMRYARAIEQLQTYV